MSNALRVSRFGLAPMYAIAGRGYLAGEAPTEEHPDRDGRFRIMNSPAAGRVVVIDRRSLMVVGTTRSKVDGTWRVSGLDPRRDYLVIGLDDRGQHNGALQDWVRPFVDG